MKSVAQIIPLTHVTDAIRQPWLGLGSATTHLAVVAVILAVSVLGWRRAVQV
jgi:ABC-type polysaccharide/polyol phosphate export permease